MCKFSCKQDRSSGGGGELPAPHPHSNCQPDSDTLSSADSLMGSASEDEEDDDNSTASSVLKHHTLHGSLPPAPGETNNNSLPHSDISSSIGQVRRDATGNGTTSKWA